MRATVKNGNHLPHVDFIAEVKQCQRCGGNLRVQKSKKRIVSTIETGTIQAREIRKVCTMDASHSVETSKTLSQMVPCGQRYGYDLIVWVGVARYLPLRSDAEQGVQETTVTQVDLRRLHLSFG